MGLLPNYENALKTKFEYLQQENSPENALAKLKLQDYQQNNALDRAYTEEQRVRERETYETDKKNKLISLRASAHLKALQNAQTDEDYKKIYLDSLGEFATDEDKNIDVKTYRNGQQIKMQVGGMEIDGPRSVLEDWYNTNKSDPTWSSNPDKFNQSLNYLQGKVGVTFRKIEGMSKEDEALKKAQVQKAQADAVKASRKEAPETREVDTEEGKVTQTFNDKTGNWENESFVSWDVINAPKIAQTNASIANATTRANTAANAQELNEYKAYITALTNNAPIGEELTIPTFDEWKSSQTGNDIQSAMPPAAQNKGRTIRDTESGKRYQSDGTNWVEIQ